MTSNTPETSGGAKPASSSGSYRDPVEALKEVGDAFNAWSGSLTSTSLQMCYALVAANWLVFGSVQELLRSGWAILSLLSLLLALAANMVAAFIMTGLHRRRYEYAEKDRDRWAAEFMKHAGTTDAWPFTKTIEIVGRVSRYIKVCLPMAGALFLFIGACTK